MKSEATEVPGERAASAGSRSDWGGRGEELGLLETPGNAGGTPSPAGTGGGTVRGRAKEGRCAVPRAKKAPFVPEGGGKRMSHPAAPPTTPMKDTGHALRAKPGWEKRAKSPSPGVFGELCPIEDGSVAPKGLGTPKDTVLGG